MGLKSFAVSINNAIEPLRNIANQFVDPLLDLVIRLYMANIFFQSGWSKFSNFLNDDWESTVFLFEAIHPLPGLSPNMAATLGTAGELILPALLALGLFARFGAAGLLIMTAAIQFLVPAEYGLQNEVHYLWMMLFAVVFVRGAGVLSLDRLLTKWTNGA